MVQITRFDGGLATRIDASLIQANQAVVLENVDPNPVTLTSGKDFMAAGPSAITGNMYLFGTNWQHSSNERSYVPYQNKLYFTDASEAPQRMLPSYARHNMGMPLPIATPALDENGQPLKDSNNANITGLAPQVDDAEFSFFNVSSYAVSIGEIDRPPSNRGINQGSYTYLLAIYEDGKYTRPKEYTVTVANQNNTTGIQFNISSPAARNFRLFRKESNTWRLVFTGKTEPDKVITFVDESKSVATFPGGYVTHVPLTNSIVLQYAVTFYNANENLESAPSAYSVELPTNYYSTIKLHNLPTTTDTQVTHMRIYRLGGNLKKMVMIAQVAKNTTVFTDVITEISDTEFTEILSTASYHPPETGMLALAEAYGIFFGIVGNELRFSEIGKPHAWPPENSFTLRGTGTAVLPTKQGVLVFTAGVTYMLTGTSKVNFALNLITEDQGCKSNNSCQTIKSNPIWVSNDGVCALQSGVVEVISRPLLGNINISAEDSEVYDGQYFVINGDELLVADFRSGYRYYTIKHSQKIDSLHSTGKSLFGGASFVKLLLAGEQQELTYLSPVYTEGRHTVDKAYTNIYIRYKGQFSFTMYINEKEVFTKQLDSSAIATKSIRPPAQKQRGYSCQFKLVGKGTVYTIETNPQGRPYAN